MKFFGITALASGLFMAIYGGLTRSFEFGDYVGASITTAAITGFCVGMVWMTEFIEGPRDNTRYVKTREVFFTLGGLVLLGLLVAFVVSTWGADAPITIERR